MTLSDARHLAAAPDAEGPARFEIEFDRDRVLDSYRRYLGVGRAALAEFMGAPVELEGEGALVRTAAGHELIDCGGYSVFLLGHRHPVIEEAVVAQVRRNPLATRVLLEPEQAAAARALCSVAPKGITKVQFLTSGAEAAELAIKLAHAHGKTHLVAMTGGFHGKTTGALAVTPNPKYQSRFRPLLDAEIVEYGNADALEAVLVANAGRAAVLIEPVQGESGVVVPPSGYLGAVDALCKKYDAMLIVDEVQTGLGRCGAMWAHSVEELEPDVLLSGKALSGGIVPCAALLATEAVFEPISRDPMLHTSTFGGSPLASAAVIALVNTLIAERVPERAGEIGARLLDELESVSAPYLGSLVTQVRGRGLLIGVEFARPDLVADVTASLLERGVVVNHSFNNHAVLRLTPPVVIDEAQLAHVVSSFDRALSELRQVHRRR